MIQLCLRIHVRMVFFMYGIKSDVPTLFQRHVKYLKSAGRSKAIAVCIGSMMNAATDCVLGTQEQLMVLSQSYEYQWVQRHKNMIPSQCQLGVGYN